MLEHLYICRHGFRANFDDMAFDIGPSGLAGDPALTPHGLHQAEELASFLSDPNRLNPHPVPEKIFSSAFYRCVQTAEPLFVALGMRGCQERIALENGVGEWIRPVDSGKPSASRPGPAKALLPYFPPGTFDERYEASLYPSLQGESEEELSNRVEVFLQRWIAQIDEMGLKSVVLLSHAAVVILLGRILTKNHKLYVPAGCASLSLYRRTKDLEWEGVWVGRSDFLAGGSERDWQFGMPE